MKNKTTAIHITKEASNTLIHGCEFVGFDQPIKNEGKGTKIIKSVFRVAEFLRPKSLISQIIVGVLIGLIVLFLGYKLGWNK